ncbi:MAG: ribosome maturation factor RimP [Pseudomonadota bacterium]
MLAFEKLSKIIKPAVEAAGYQFWGLEYNAHGHRKLLRVYIDSENGINVDDCAAASHQISGVLDVEDPINAEYVLEVSSPGLDRPLFIEDHYKVYIGQKVVLRLRLPKDGRRRISGQISHVGAGYVEVIQDEQSIKIPINSISKANLVPQF